MIKREAILQSIYRAVDSFNRRQAGVTPLAKSEDTVLFGTGGGLDSLGLVTLIVNTEQQLGDDLGRPFTLVDERALSSRNSPFRTLGTLADYVLTLCEDDRRG